MGANNLHLYQYVAGLFITSYPLLSSTGFLSILCVCCVYLGHHLPPLHPSAMAILRCQYLCVGAVCLAHR